MVVKKTSICEQKQTSCDYRQPETLAERCVCECLIQLNQL